MIETTTTASSLSIAKNSSYLAAFIATTAWLGINPLSVEILAGFIILDVITGVLAAAFIDGPSSVRSSVLQRGIVAKLLLILVPFTVALSGKGVGIEMAVLAGSCLNVLVLSEGYSIIGNIYAIRTGQHKEEFDAISAMLRGLQGALKRVIIDDTVAK